MRRRASGRPAAAAGSIMAVVPAGGAGRRMGGRIPKQFLGLGATPILVRTVRALARAPGLAGVVVAAPGPRVEATRRLLARFRVPRIHAVVAGGRERQESVWRGLQALPAGVEVVVVHDAVRPFVTPGLVERVVAAARRTGAATCGLPVRETVKRVRDGAVEATLDRAGLWLVQTPQAFRHDLLQEAHDKARRDGRLGTDDAVLVEWLGAPVAMVSGLPENLKITTPDDLRTARRWLTRAPRAAGRAARPRLP